MRPDAAMLGRLAALGLTAEQIAGVAAILEEADEARRAAKREGNRERTIRSRLSRAVTRDTCPVTRDSEGVTRDPSPPKKGSPEPPPKNHPPTQLSQSPVGDFESRARAKRGSRVDGFEPDIAVALEIGLSPTEARREAEIFLDHWRGKPGQHGVKADWLATWRNWCRNTIKRRPAARGFQRTIDEQGNHDGSSDERGGGGYFAKEAELRRRQFAERQA